MPKKKTDYRMLLKKYMNRIGEQEGVYFIHPEADSMQDFSSDEHSILITIINELEEELLQEQEKIEKELADKVEESHNEGESIS